MVTKIGLSKCRDLSRGDDMMCAQPALQYTYNCLLIIMYCRLSQNLSNWLSSRNLSLKLALVKVRRLVFWPDKGRTFSEKDTEIFSKQDVFKIMTHDRLSWTLIFHLPPKYSSKYYQIVFLNNKLNIEHFDKTVSK